MANGTQCPPGDGQFRNSIDYGTTHKNTKRNALTERAKRKETKTNKNTIILEFFESWAERRQAKRHKKWRVTSRHLCVYLDNEGMRSEVTDRFIAEFDLERGYLRPDTTRAACNAHTSTMLNA